MRSPDRIGYVILGKCLQECCLFFCSFCRRLLYHRLTRGLHVVVRPDGCPFLFGQKRKMQKPAQHPAVVISESSVMCCEKGSGTSPHLSPAPLPAGWSGDILQPLGSGDTAHCHFDLHPHLPLPSSYEER